MNAAHFHLLVNHFPVILPIVGTMVLLIGLLIKSEAVKRTGFLIFILGSISSIVAMTSGEGAEEVVENLAGVTENYIEAHEEAAELFAIFSYILGGISLLGFWASFTKKSFTNTISIITIIFAGVTLFFGQKAGTTGGEIRHTEIREVTVQSDPGNLNKGETEDND